MNLPSPSSWLLRHFRRVTSSKVFLPEIDGLRFVAIATVVACHLILHVAENMRGFGWTPEKATPAALQLGSMGVQLFFVISGFIVSLPFVRAHAGLGERLSYGAFLRRRVTRLEPPYILVLLFFFGVARIFPHRLDPSLLVPSLFASLTYTHQLLFPGKLPFILGVAWTLEIEIQFYLLAPVFCWLYLQIKPPAVRRIVAVALAGLWSALCPILGWVPLTLAGKGGFFLMGIVVCDLVVAGEPRGAIFRSRRAAALVWGTLLVLGTVQFVKTTDWALKASYPWLLGLVCLLPTVNPFLKRTLSHAMVVVIGGMCYSIYLLHTHVMMATGFLIRSLGLSWGPGWYLFVQCVLRVGAILVVSAIFFKLIERPCMKRDWPAALAARIRRGLGQRRDRTAGAATILVEDRADSG